VPVRANAAARRFARRANPGLRDLDVPAAAPAARGCQNPAMDITTYRELRAQARRLVRRETDADDLVQEAMLVALQSGRSDLPWLIGVMRNRETMMRRSALRRRRREQHAVQQENDNRPVADEQAQVRDLLPRLPPSARRVAVLALHGLSADEICWILVLAPTAFRQRLSTIRRALTALPPSQRAEALALAYVRDPARSVELQFGLVRRALKAALRDLPGIATHDGDGHLLVIRTAAHTSPSSGNQASPITAEGDIPC
jgi:RNA polymerase sigma factor (sigma-70 family)